MNKIDFKKELKELYNPSSRDFTIVDVPKMNYLMIDGQGNPNTSPDYADVVEALYSVAYTLKFSSKKLGKDYSVMPLEGLWTADELDAFTTRAKDTWKWTMMIMQPNWITDDMVKSAIETVRKKKNPRALDRIRFEAYEEGTSVQIMHVGSYDDEAPTLHKLHTKYMPEHGFTFGKPHHEIYLGDPRRTAPAKLRTILRQPVVGI